MSIKIYFPTNDYLSDLTQNFSKLLSRYDLERIDETAISNLLNNSKVDLALVDPITYANISSENEYAIVPTKCLLAAGYTGIATIYFAKYLRDIQTLAYSPENNFLAILASIILKEKYSFETENIELINISINDLKNYDAIIHTQKFDGYNNTLDLTEEWFDAFEYPLPFAFWIAPIDSDYDSITQITNLMFDSSPKDKIISQYNQSETFYYHREGIIANEFSEEAIKSIEDTIQLFYQIGLIDNMKDLRILGNKEID